MSDGQLQSQDVVKQILATTPARLLVGRSGPAYRTETWLKLRADHAAAHDTVYAELDLLRDFGEDQLNSFQLFRVQTQAKTKSEYLMRPIWVVVSMTITTRNDCKVVSERCGFASGDRRRSVIGCRGMADNFDYLDLLNQEASRRNWRFR